MGRTGASEALRRTWSLVGALLVALLVATLVTACGGSSGTSTAGGSVPETTTTAPSGPVATGKQLFLDNGCTSCHTLAAAGSSGSVGPNLDDDAPSAATVIDAVTNGKGLMPSFSGQLTPAQIQDIAAFITAST